MESCIFCKIINKEIPSEIICENENIIAFKDVNPAAPIHVLVIPKKHIAKLTDLKEEDGIIIQEIFKCINKVAEIQKMKEDGFRVITNCGNNGGQQVDHLHFHVLGGKHLGPKICS